MYQEQESSQRGTCSDKGVKRALSREIAERCNEFSASAFMVEDVEERPTPESLFLGNSFEERATSDRGDKR